MLSTSIFPCIMTMISNFTMFFIFQIFILKFFFTNVTDFCIFIWFLLLFLSIASFFQYKISIFIAFSLKNSQDFFILSLPKYTSCLFYILLNEDIADIEKPYGIYLLTSVADAFPESFLHPSIFSIIHSRSA